MADAGFNVFLGNNRGNSYSYENTHLDPKKNAKEFFDYSFADLGLHDLPA